MAGNNLILANATTGWTLYFVIQAVQSGATKYWNTGTPAFESYNSSHWGNYAISMSETGATGSFSGTFPSLSADTYAVQIRKQVGGSPAVSDTFLGSGSFTWDGSQEVDLLEVISNIGSPGPDDSGPTGISDDDANLIVNTLFAKVVDSVPFGSLMEAVKAVLTGTCTVVDNVITFNKSDGTTAKVVIVADPDGNRTHTQINP